MKPLERTTITYKQEVRSSSLRPPTILSEASFLYLPT
jgi:hypothetical protein